MIAVCRFSFLLAILCHLAAFVGYAQQAQVSGLVADQTGGVIPDASLEFLHTATQDRSEARTNAQGRYTVSSLRPGVYQVNARARGFETKVLEGVRLEVAAKLTLDVVLNIGIETSSVTVDAGNVQLNTIDASMSTVVDQGFVQNIPMNGRSFQSLLTLIPGVISVPSSGAGVRGQIAVNGMRAESNYFMVDGVSANTGVNTDSPGRGAGYSGSLPSGTALGTTQTLTSMDALQEFRGITSTYSAEYGRVPGGQFSFTTKSGTNQLHGSLYEYFRNDVMDANSFFNNRNGVGRVKMRQNNYGGTLGGPVFLPKLYDGRDRTFFFFAYEGLQLRSPQESRITSVPTLALRNEIAPVALRRFLSAFPLPTPGYAEESGYTAPFVSSYSQPSEIYSSSVRLDHSFSDNFRVFGRYAYTPSSATSRYSSNMAQVTDSNVNNKALTLGATNVLSPFATNEARFNVTWNDQLTKVRIDDFGGATPLAISDFDGLSETDWALFSYRVNTRPGFWLNPQNNRQRQFNFIDTFTFITGNHTLKAGVDWRLLRTDSSLAKFYQTPFYYTQAQLLTNTPQLNTAYRSTGSMAPVYKNLSLFLQDEWAVSARLRLSLGLRWEWTPAPMDANGNQPLTVDQLDDLATTKLAPQGSRLWKTRYNHFAPRLGIAYNLRQHANYQTVLRVGGGMFYDTSTTQASEGYWYGAGITGTLNLNNQPFPLTAEQLNAIPAPSPILTSTSYANVFAFDPNLKMPYALQWNATIEQQMGSNNVFNVGYVGSQGKQLLLARQYFPERLNNPNFPVGAAYLYATVSGASSNYHALQTQFRRHMSKGLQVLASYTWSHAIDDATSNFTSRDALRASSSYDIRHNFQAALAYDLPSAYQNGFARALLGGWGLDSRISSRSALPVDVIASNDTNAAGIAYIRYPDLDTTQPLYVEVAGAPGGRAININAFKNPAAGVSGNAGRNIARGFAGHQTDLAVRRSFSLGETTRLTFRAEAFNLFNHANFGSITSNIQTNTATNPFGWATGTQAGQLGGLNPLYQVGGPRSIQLALRLQF